MHRACGAGAQHTTTSAPNTSARAAWLPAAHLQGMKTGAIARKAGCGERHVRTIQSEEATQVLIAICCGPTATTRAA